MNKYRNKPIIIEAEQFTRETFDSIKKFTDGRACLFSIERSIDGKYTCVVPIDGVEHYLTEGDWVVKGVEDKFSFYKPAIFDKTYEKVTN